MTDLTDLIAHQKLAIQIDDGDEASLSKSKVHRGGGGEQQNGGSQGPKWLAAKKHLGRAIPRRLGWPFRVGRLDLMDVSLPDGRRFAGERLMDLRMEQRLASVFDGIYLVPGNPL